MYVSRSASSHPVILKYLIGAEWVVCKAYLEGGRIERKFYFACWGLEEIDFGLFRQVNTNLR